jgi:hypothetical protein
LSTTAVGGGIAVARIGDTIPLAYGPVRATGMQAIQHADVAGVQYGAFLLGDGAWDGPAVVWINQKPFWFWDRGSSGAGDPTIDAVFHFHPGIDTPAGTSLTSATSTGGDQLLDEIWSDIPDFVNRLTWSRLAYYMVKWTPGSGDNSTLSVIADWRSRLCRIFDADGNQIDYRYTTNPAWHFVDAWLCKAIKPTYALTTADGPDALTSSERSYFVWESIAESAAYFDQVLSNGRPRFSGGYFFAAQTNLAAILEQVLLCCRSYSQEKGGKIQLICDKPRSSVFVLKSTHLVPNTLTVDEKSVSQNANRYERQFYDVRLPAIVQLTSITVAGDGTGTITSADALPTAIGDIVYVGGSGTSGASGDGYYHITGGTTGSNTMDVKWLLPGAIPVGTFAGGSVGYPQSRFAQRAPYKDHRQHQLAKGWTPTIGGGREVHARTFTPPAPHAGGSKKRLTVSYDFGNCTNDQTARILTYEKNRDLGYDVSPWQPPKGITLQAFSQVVDENWSILKKKQCGDVITIDPSASFEYQGDFEIMEQRRYAFQADVTTLDGEPIKSADQQSGILELVLRTFDGTVLGDDDSGGGDDGSWPNVPNDSLGSTVIVETIVPATSLNGWGANGHVGDYEGGVSQGHSFGLDAAGATAYVNPDAVFDGDVSTKASAAFQHTHQYAGCVWSFAAASPPAGSLSLNVLSEVPANAEDGLTITLRSAGIWYSLDSGATWTQLYSSAGRTKQWDSVALPGGQDVTHVQVMAFIDGHDDMAHYVYEINIQGVSS